MRLEAGWTDSAAREQAARREAAEAQNRAHALHVEVLRLAQQAEAASARPAALAGELEEADAQLEALAERQAAGEARFEELDADLATAQGKHAEIDDGVIAAEHGRSPMRASSSARSNARRRRPASRREPSPAGAASCNAASRPRRRRSSNQAAGAQLELELGAFDDASAQSGLQAALALKLDREQVLAAARGEYDDLAAKMRAADERRLQIERSLEPQRERITALQLGSRRHNSAARSTWSS
ncbi:MAG: hypothetical protein U1F25_15700 [Rubrivivax sp.]